MRSAPTEECRACLALAFAATSGWFLARSPGTTECVGGPEASEVASEAADSTDHASPSRDRQVDGAGLGTDDPRGEPRAGTSTEHRGAETTRCRSGGGI